MAHRGPARKVVDEDHVIDGSRYHLLSCGHTLPWGRGTWSHRYCRVCPPDPSPKDVSTERIKLLERMLRHAADRLAGQCTCDVHTSWKRLQPHLPDLCRNCRHHDEIMAVVGRPNA